MYFHLSHSIFFFFWFLLWPTGCSVACCLIFIVFYLSSCNSLLILYHYRLKWFHCPKLIRTFVWLNRFMTNAGECFMHLRRMCTLLLWNRMFCIHLLGQSGLTDIFSLIFCLDDLYIDASRVLKSLQLVYCCFSLYLC